MRVKVALAVLLLPCVWRTAASSRDDGQQLRLCLQELTASLQGLRTDLREGLSNLATELQQNRVAREEVAHVLRLQEDENRRVMENLRHEVMLLTENSSGYCPPGQRGDGDAEAAPESSAREREAPKGLPGLQAPAAPTPQPPPPPPPPLVTDCPAPFLHAGPYCLTLLRDPTPWEAARARCHSYARTQVGGSVGGRQVSGDLVVPHDMDAFKAFIQRADFREAPSGWAWVGGSAEGWGGVWAWVDGSLMKELPWVYSQTGQDGRFLAVDKDAVFHTVNRRTSLWPVCQLR